MINLLDKKNKKGIKHEYYFRFAYLCLQMLFFASLISVVLLLPSYIFTLNRSEAQNVRVANVQKSPNFQAGGELSTQIREVQNSMNLFSSEQNYVITQDIIDPLLVHADAPDLHIHVYEIVYEETGDKDEVLMRVRGVAENRNQLISFVSLLREEAIFADIQVPVSNLAQDQDVRFTLSLTTDITNFES